MRRANHDGFVINARAIPLKDVLGWPAEFDLEKHSGDDVTSAPFAVRGTYESEDSAIEAAILHGRRKIDDGFHPDRPLIANSSNV
jgi:hypothetical protein